MKSMTKTLLLTILIALAATPAFALNPTTTGRIAVTPASDGANGAIWVSAYYTEDTNANNTLQITWKLSSSGVWPAPQYTLPHAASPYSQKITGLTNGTEYDVRVKFVDADGVTGTNPQYAYRVIPSTMMHNSENATTGTRKWDAQGGWGVPGGVYGQFECSTCHTSGLTTNIMRVWTTIATPNGASWGSTSRSKLPVRFRSRGADAATGFGDDSDSHTASTRICEVCHIQTDYHRYNTTGQPGGTGHYNNADCTSSCHKHSGGFKGAGGVCNACHGATPSVFWSTDMAGSYPGNNPGAHASHFGLDQWYTTAYDDTNLSTASYYRFQCNKCHGSDHSASPTPNITLSSTNPPRSNGGSYGSATNQCSNVYCHGATLTAGSVPAPTWTTTPLSCGACHGADGTTPPTAGSHERHAKSGTYGAGKQGLNLPCTDCHTSTAGATNHVNGDVLWGLNTTNARFGAAATYRGATAGSTGAEAPSGSYGQCSNVYCHSGVQTSPPGGVPTNMPITWGGTTTCASCHVDQTTAWSGSHQKHMAYPYTCGNCHDAAGSETTKHADQSIGVKILAWGSGTYSGTPAPGNAYGSCNSVYCHSNGMASPTYATPGWGSASTGNCGTCHGVNNTTPPASAPHAKHVATASGYRYSCSKCHSTVVSATADSTIVPTIADYTLHVNNAKNVAFDSWNSVGAYNTPSCTVTYCHSQGTGGTGQTGDARALGWRTMNWSGTTTCGSCHGADATGQPQYVSGTPKMNSHAAHLPMNTVVSCSVCHYATTSTNTTITSVGRHVNKAYDIVKDTSWRTINYTYAADGGTCAATACHAGQTAKWGSTGYGTYSLSGDWNCISCHSYSFRKNLGTGTIRKVVGTGGDFAMGTIISRTWTTTFLFNQLGASRHLFGASTIVKWDCIVCHREGQASGGSAGGVNWAMHNETGGLIHLRNVDTVNENVGWQIDNRGWTTNDYTNLDTFCLSCHDSDGASQVSVNATDNGISNTRDLTPFNTTDVKTWGGVDSLSGSAEMQTAARNRVVDVKSQFYAGTAVGPSYNGNPSQHAVIGRRYSTINRNWGSVVGGRNAWTTWVLRKSGQSIRVVKETALLSCADCHVLDAGSGAHGGRGAFNLRWATGNLDMNCWGCHSRDSYLDSVTVANPSRMLHGDIDGGNPYTNASGSRFGKHGSGNWCMNCHAGFDGTTTVTKRLSYGGIHGAWGTYNAGALVTKYRFFPGTFFKKAGPDTQWTATTAITCYFNPSTEAAPGSFTYCSRHGASSGADVSPQYSRPVNY